MNDDDRKDFFLLLVSFLDLLLLASVADLPGGVRHVLVRCALVCHVLVRRVLVRHVLVRCVLRHVVFLLPRVLLVDFLNVIVIVVLFFSSAGIYASRKERKKLLI
jgi:hypothetical protein